MTTKKRYVVNFFKTVSTDFGEDREIRQRSVEVFATDEHDAEKQAKDELCRLEGLSDWSLHADRCTSEQLEFPA